MSETSWVLKGVDPEVREQAAEEAARLGVSLSDYLSEKLLHAALREQVAAQTADATIVPEAPQLAPDAGFAPRHRIEAVERRLGVAVGTFESAIQALDTSLVELAARADETEAAASETSGALVEVVQEIGANLNALRKRLADAEDTTETLGESHEAAYEMFADRCDRLDERLQIVDTVARGAEKAAADLARAQEALKYAVAEDFSEFARDTTDRLAAGLNEVRSAADNAAAQADAAVAHLVTELCGVRDRLERRMQESVAETRARVQAAFSEAGERVGALADRVTVNERATTQLRAQLADVEDGAQTALEETAESLRQAGAALAAEFARATQDNRFALESVHADLSNEIADLRERQAGDAARIKLVDSAVGATANEISAIRQLVGSAMGDIATARAGLTEAEASIAAVYETFDARFAEADSDARERLSHLRAEITTRFEAAAVHEDERQRKADEAAAAFQLETERIEACTLAALEQLSKNFTAGDAALDAKLEARLGQVENATDTLIAQVSQRLEGQIAELRDGQSGASAHLKLIDRTLSAQNFDAAVEAAVSPVRDQLIRIEHELSQRARGDDVSARLDQLEAAASKTETEQALAVLKHQVDAIAAQMGALRLDQGVAQRVDDLRARLGAVEGKNGEIADQMQGVARLIGRSTAQNTEASKQTDERLHKIEMALADIRLEHLSEAAAPKTMDAVAEIAKRMADLEERQAETLKALQADIVHFIAESDRRLAAVEDGGSDVNSAELTKSFESLRVSVEERILGIELRSVRTLEQVADTVAMLEERLTGPELAPEAAQKAG